MPLRLLSVALALLLALFGAPAWAQGFEPGVTPTVELLRSPEDGVAWFEKRRAVEQLYGQERWAEAEAGLRGLLQDQPRDGELWDVLGQVLSRQGKHEEAAEAFERAGPLMGWTLWSSPRLAAAAARLAAGDREEALRLIQVAMETDRNLVRRRMYDWAEFAALKDDPRFQALTGRFDVSGLDRAEGLRRDVDFLISEVKRVNPDYHDEPLPAEVTRRQDALKADAASLTDHQFFIRLRHMLAPLNQGHVALWMQEGGRFLPLRFYLFPEGVFIIEAEPEYAELAGAQVLAIGGMPIEEVQKVRDAQVSLDGPMLLAWGVGRLNEAHALAGSGIVPDADRVAMTVRMASGEVREVTVQSRDRERPGRQDRLWPPSAAPSPLFLSRMDERHWEQRLGDDTLYAQINNIMDDEDETLSAFAIRLRPILADDAVRNLIVDLRHNNGGSTYDSIEMVRTLVGFSQLPGRKLYVLIGRRTYSAAANFITDLERLADPVFVGEASSECCNFYGDPSALVLPYSKVAGEVTAVKWNLSVNVFDGRREMTPDVPIQMQAADYFAGRDPVLDGTLRMIAARRE